VAYSEDNFCLQEIWRGTAVTRYTYSFYLMLAYSMFYESCSLQIKTFAVVAGLVSPQLSKWVEACE
jgi:hypothetical protein